MENKMNSLPLLSDPNFVELLKGIFLASEYLTANDCPRERIAELVASLQQPTKEDISLGIPCNLTDLFITYYKKDPIMFEYRRAMLCKSFASHALTSDILPTLYPRLAQLLLLGKNPTDQDENNGIDPEEFGNIKVAYLMEDPIGILIEAKMAKSLGPIDRTPSIFNVSNYR